MSRDSKEITTKYKRAITTMQKQQDIIEELRSENDFLSSTIINNRGGKIAEERRRLQQDILLSESRERVALKELAEYQEEHEGLSQELSKRISEVKRKQADINAYIKKEASKISKKKEQELSKQYREKERRLETEYNDKAVFYEGQIKLLKRVVVLAIAYALVITIILILGR